MNMTPEMMQRMANQQEQQKRDDEQKKYFELSEQAKLYQAALTKRMHDQVLDVWKYEEFGPKEVEDEDEDVITLSTENKDTKIKDGIYTREGASKGVIFRDGKLSPHGNEWTTGFDKNGWNEVLEFARQKLGTDTVEFDFGDLGRSSKFFGFEVNYTRRLAIKQLEGILELAKEKGMAVELGPNARKLVRELAEDDDYKGKFKNIKGEVVHYEHKIDEQLQDLKDNRDYQNMKMGLGNAAFQKFNAAAEQPTLNKTEYANEVYQKLGADGKPVPGVVEDNKNLRADAAEKAIKEIEARVKDNDGIIGKLDAVKDQQSKMIEKSDVKEVLDKIKEVNASGKPARAERDNAVSKIEKRNENDLKRIEELKAQIEKDIKEIKDKAALPAPGRALNDKEKEAIAKNEKSLESLTAMKTKIEEQNTTKLDVIKAWDKKDKGRDEAIKDRKDKLAAREAQTQRPTNS